MRPQRRAREAGGPASEPGVETREEERRRDERAAAEASFVSEIGRVRRSGSDEGGSDR